MSDSVLMPALGESVTEGTVTRWLKQVGDTVEVDEPLLEVSTDKVDTEIPSPYAGTLLEILVPEDETVEVGAALAVIGAAGESSVSDGGGAEESDGAQASGGAEASDGAADEAEQQAAQVPDEVTDDASGGPVEEPDAAGGQGEATQQAAAPQEAPAVAGQGDAQGGGGDAQDVTLPALGESVTEGTVTRWLKQVGETVEVDEPLLEVSTDKVDTEIPSPFAGTVTEILVQEDETVEVGAVLARVGSGSAGGAPATAPEEASAPQPAAADAVEQSADEQQGGDYGGPGPEAESAPAEQVQAPQPSQAAQAKPEQTQAPGQAAAREQTPTSAPSAAAAAPSAPSAASGGAPAGGYLTPLVRKLAAE
ncbi:dihydrolipoamide acetyltransferase, partial [Actinotalea ferrariae CF5-4]